MAIEWDCVNEMPRNVKFLTKTGVGKKPLAAAFFLLAILAVSWVGLNPVFLDRTLKADDAPVNAQAWLGAKIAGIHAFLRKLGGIGALSRKTAKGPKVALLKETFQTLNYDWEGLLRGDGMADVPRVILAGVPDDLRAVGHVREKKMLFFKVVLPLILRVNEEIARDRGRLAAIDGTLAGGGEPSAADKAWLVALAKRYRIDEIDTKKLLIRVDAIPVSLALAQAAEESGWGSSRFAREGNALFGQWTYSTVDKGITPKNRDKAKKHRVRAFGNLIESVRAYARNLNTNKVYGNFRRIRANRRLQGHKPEGAVLAGTLTNYSERGQAYVDGIRAIIDANDLGGLDTAKLRDGKPVTVPSV